MKFSESWLRRFVDPPCSSEELAHLLTMAGLEVEAVERVAPAFERVVVGEVLEVTDHPEAARLRVCRVDVGGERPLQVVCGAPNVRPALKAACALAGAQLPEGMRIVPTQVRGVDSSAMLCSESELGLGEDASGLLVLPGDARVGDDLRTYLELDDRLFTLKLTPNRADCLSLEGVAREVAALAGVPARFIEVDEVAVTSSAQRPVLLDAPAACARYCGRVISGVDAKAATPHWITRRLERSGIRPISALVDITNYVMLELGQPLHAFDNTRLFGAVHARMARPGERLRLLNEQTLELHEDVLVIADDRHAVAMAGIMGGEDSGIAESTRDVFLESAFFAPKAIAGRARRYGFGSDASHRFERGVDFGGTRRALERATRLIVDICGGDAGPVSDAVARLPEREAVRLRAARVGKVLGVDIDAPKMAQIFTRLSLPFAMDGDDFLVTPPTYRFDLEIEEDLIEEVARLYGYESVPAPAPRARLSMLPAAEAARPLADLRRILVDAGYQEVVNYAFVDERWESDFAGNSSPLRLANPIASQMSVMRSTLVGGLLANLATNLRRRQSRVRVFESGRCFERDEHGTPVPGFHQPWRLAALAYGSALPEQWGCPARQVDFFDVKGDLEALLLPAQAIFEKASHPALHPGRSARVVLDGQPIGFVGELHPQWQQKYELPLPPVLFELELEPLMRGRLPAYSEVSRQPIVLRDLAIVVDQQVELRTLLAGMASNRPPIVRQIRLFDVYSGHGIEAGKKSLAFRVTMQDTRKTLLEGDVEAAVQHLVGYLQQAFAARLRV